MSASVRRRLIVNADDFGLSPGVNGGIAQAFEKGIVTSTSLLVRGPAAAEAARYARANPALSLGLHLDLGEWCFEGGAWRPRYEVVPLDDETAVRREVARQLEFFRDLTGSAPSHLDSHQHVHLREPVRTALLAAAEPRGVAVRHLHPKIRYCGSFYGQSAEGVPVPEAISAAALVRIIAELPEGLTELACHPGFAEGLDSMYSKEREMEIEALCSKAVREEVHASGIELCGFDPAAAYP